MQLPAGINSRLHADLTRAVGESYVAGFRLSALICAGLALAGAFCGWVMIKEKPSKRASLAVTRESAVDENEFAVRTAPTGLPDAQAQQEDFITC
jgi:hypothetical protein